jgi:hypothetical protein
MVKAHCLFEKRKEVKLKEPITYEVNKLGTIVAYGMCPSCGKKIHTFIKTSDAPEKYQREAESVREQRKLNTAKKLKSKKTKKGGQRNSRRSKKGGRSRKKSRTSRRRH